MATEMRAKETKRQAQPVTVPDWVEKKLGLEDGDWLLFLEENGRVFLQREARRPLQEVIGSLATDRPFLADDELDAELERVMADDVRDEYARIFKGEG